ncbi:CD276 antigen homolog [Protopterus annectens]|uniref:CD276 antigen homolog n=1 Tax=Protopterus annectens TaxID=7888 RepID=UPI001CFBCC31|nr:CD276 antigen homolog [Protopterus annectens]
MLLCLMFSLDTAVKQFASLTITPSHVMAGDDIVMTCALCNRSSDSRITKVIWVLSVNGEPGYVEYFPDINKEDQNIQHIQTKVEYKSDKASLTVQNASTLLNGICRCIIFFKDSNEELPSLLSQLTISAPYIPPEITSHSITGKESLQCISSGGYPEGQVMWHYRNGSILTKSVSTQHISNGMGSFDINSTISLGLQKDAEICCSVIHTVLQKNWTTCTDTAAQERRRWHMIAVPFAVVAFALIIALLLYCTSVKEADRMKLWKCKQ